MVISLLATVLIGGTVVTAASSFSGQGTVAFDSIRVGKQGEGGVTYFNGSIVNVTTTNGADNPITFGDGVRIDGRIWRGATPGRGDGQPLTVNDDFTVEGDIRWDDGTSLSSIWNSQAALDTALVATDVAYQTAISNLQHFVVCVGGYAEISTFIEAADYISCYNTWIAGTTLLGHGGASGGAPDGLTLEELVDVQRITAEQSVDGESARRLR